MRPAPKELTTEQKSEIHALLKAKEKELVLSIEQYAENSAPCGLRRLPWSIDTARRDATATYGQGSVSQGSTITCKDTTSTRRVGR